MVNEPGEGGATKRVVVKFLCSGRAHPPIVSLQGHVIQGFGVMLDVPDRIRGE